MKMYRKGILKIQLKRLRNRWGKRGKLFDVITTERGFVLSNPRQSGLGSVFSPHSSIYQQKLRSLQSMEEAHQENQEERRANRNLGIAFASAGFALVGFVFPILNLFSLTGILFINFVACKSVYHSIMRHRKLNVDVLCVLMLPMFVAQKLYLVMSLTSIVYAGYNRVLITIKDSATKKTINVFKDQPRKVWVPSNPAQTADTRVVEVPLTSLQTGDSVVVHMGETIPVDGVVTDGAALVDQHLLTGEAQPVERSVGESVYALTTVLSGQISIQIDKAGIETTAAQIGRILNQTVDQKTDMQLQIEALTDISIGPTLILCGFALPVFGPLTALGILYTHPKYRLLLPASLGIFSYLNIAAQNNILIKDSQALERLNQVDTVVFDKTGTLTEEQPRVGNVFPAQGYQEDDILAYAAAAEGKQSHPIARAILQEAYIRQLDIPITKDAEFQVGYGLAAVVQDQLIRVGSARYMAESNVSIPVDLEKIQLRCHAQGHSVILVAIDDEAAGAIELLPTIRPEAEDVIASLCRQGGNTVYVVSGDHELPTRQLARQLDISDYAAETLPQDKAQLIEQLQQSGKTVCYVGDGINDSIALRQADVSISLGGASSVAVDTAQIVLMDGTLKQLSLLYDLARRFESNAKTSATLVLGPTALMLAGVFWLQLSMPTIFLMGLGGFSASMLSSLWPLLTEQSKPLKTALPARLIPENGRYGKNNVGTQL